MERSSLLKDYTEKIDLFFGGIYFFKKMSITVRQLMWSKKWQRALTKMGKLFYCMLIWMLIKLLCLVFPKILSILTEGTRELLAVVLERITDPQDWWFQKTGKEYQGSYPRLNSNCTNTRANNKQTSCLQALEEGKRRRILTPPGDCKHLIWLCIMYKPWQISIIIFSCYDRQKVHSDKEAAIGIRWVRINPLDRNKQNSNIFTWVRPILSPSKPRAQSHWSQHPFPNLVPSPHPKTDTCQIQPLQLDRSYILVNSLFLPHNKSLQPKPAIAAHQHLYNTTLLPCSTILPHAWFCEVLWPKGPT